MKTKRSQTGNRTAGTPAETITTAATDNSPLAGLQARLARVPPRLATALCVLLVGLIAYATFFHGRAEPPHAFWDENYHVTAAERYIEGVGYMESHPPLGKLLIAAGEVLSGTNADVDKHILVRDKYIDGDKIPANFSFAGMRLMPSLFGMLGALPFFGLMFALTGKRWMALLFSSLYLFENAWAVHFRAVHLDSFQMFFSVCALWLFVRLWQREQAIPWWQYGVMGLLCGLAIMIKVNAAILLALFPVLYFRDRACRTCPDLFAQARNFVVKAGTATLAVAFVVFTIFAIHAVVANHLPEAGTSSADKDTPHMSEDYKAYLAGQRSLTPGVLMSISRDYYNFMEQDHKGVPKLDTCKPDENGSHPITWPVHHKTINYRWDMLNGYTRYVQLAGNQFSWYLGLAAVLMSLLLVANHRIFKIPVEAHPSYALIEVFTGLYVLFMGLHLYIGALRVMYLYHYFLGLLISYILLVLNLQYLFALHKVSPRARAITVGGLVAGIFGSYLFFSPLTNYQPLNKQQCELRNVFTHIVDCQ